MQKTMNSSNDYLLRWPNHRGEIFSELKNAKFELLAEHPNKTINVCIDGPKILVLPNASDILYCYTRDQWIEKLWSDLRLSAFHYPIIVLNMLIFLFGTTGNVFVCLSVYRNHRLRNVTNYFIVNLAFADLLVILICLPTTVIWDLSLTWFFGTIPCKLIMYLQDVSISVSVLTLTVISVDRYYAICYPFKFKSNLSQATRVILLIWLLSLAIMSPDLLYLSARKSEELEESGLDTVLYSDCNYNWSQRSSMVFQFVKTILLYLVPFLLMLVAHYKIMRTLHLASASVQNKIQIMSQLEASRAATQEPACVRQKEEPLAPASAEQDKLVEQLLQLSGSSSPNQEEAHMKRTLDSEAAAIAKYGQSHQENRSIWRQSNKNRYRNNSIFIHLHKTNPSDKVGSLGGSKELIVSMHNKDKLESRRNAAKMLMAIVVLFGICYLPVHLINFLRQFIDDIPQTDVTSSLSMLAHCICYLNSAINPIIYNYMNSIFRAEFKRFLSCFGKSAPAQTTTWNGAQSFHHESNIPRQPNGAVIELEI